MKEYQAFDAHIHLTDSEYSGYLQHLLNTLRSLKINSCSVTVNLETSIRSLNLFGEDTKDIVTQFLGIHPEFADEELNGFENLLKQNLSVVDGIGEVGIDTSYELRNGASYNRQKFVFYTMLCLAEKFDKPGR